MAVRLNQFIAHATGLSRRAADVVIAGGRVRVNGVSARIGQTVTPEDQVTLDGQPIRRPEALHIVLNKPVGYACSRRRQGATPTIYELLPKKYHGLKTVGRL